jgi:hypothetical protein
MSAERSHDRIEELVALDALAGLDDAERAELAAALADHGDACPVCADILGSTPDAVAAFAFALEPVEAPDGAEDRLIAAALARGGPDAAGDQAEPWRAPVAPQVLTSVPAGTGAERAHGKRRSIGRWIAAAAVAAALVLGGVSGFVAAPRAPSGTEQFLAFASKPGTRFAAFPTTDGSSLTVAYHPGETNAWIFGSGLDKPAGGKTYQLWWGTKGTPLEGMHSAGVFVPIHGNVVSPVTVDASQPGTLLGITIEPPGGSPEPTSPPITATTV